MPASEPQRRRIEDLLAQYELEPELHDVFVEGSLDQQLIQSFLHTRAKTRRTTVHRISTIEVPTSEVLAFGQPDGERGRIITLAHMLQMHSGNEDLPILCIADLDLDMSLGTPPSSKYLSLTDFTSAEMYLYDEAPVGKFFSIALSHPPLDPDRFLAGC